MVRRGPGRRNARARPALGRGLLVVARVVRRDLVRVALPRGVRRIPGRELSRREVGVAGRDPFLELHDVEAGTLRALGLLILHDDLLPGTGPDWGLNPPRGRGSPRSGARCAHRSRQSRGGFFHPRCQSTLTGGGRARWRRPRRRIRSPRSEEHTSELQSQSNLVCRLLLEKKKDGESVDPWPAGACLREAVRRVPRRRRALPDDQFRHGRAASRLLAAWHWLAC